MERSDSNLEWNARNDAGPLFGEETPPPDAETLKIRPRAVRPRLVHPNSGAALQQHADSGTVGGRRAQILDVVTRYGPVTDRNVKDLIRGLNDMNQVRPWITRMIRDGLLVDAGKTKCRVTGAPVRLVKVVATEEAEEAEGGGDAVKTKTKVVTSASSASSVAKSRACRGAAKPTEAGQ